jgi:predicted nucleic acid-binding protein
MNRLVMGGGVKDKENIPFSCSFTLMRQLGIKTLFAFDKHFKEQRFQGVP